MFDSLWDVRHQSSGSRSGSCRGNRDYYDSSYHPSRDRGNQEIDDRDMPAQYVHRSRSRSLPQKGRQAVKVAQVKVWEMISSRAR